jgi:hypothetical protein
MWVECMFGGNVALAVHTDAKTVEALESLVPGVLNKDLKFLGEGMVKN